MQVRLHAALGHVQMVLREETTSADVFTSPTDALTARFQSALAEYAADSGKVAPLTPGGEEVKFDTRDYLGWVVQFPGEWLEGRRRHSFLALPEVEREALRRLRLALFSDWGTGLYGAWPISEAIVKDSDGFDYVIHLGDVYYAGTEREYEERFLRLWPYVDGARNRALNGNHEMYSGGYGYFNLALPRFGQSSSVIAIQNRDWLIVGLDTAYSEFDLAKSQAEWLQGLVANAGRRKVVLLSHHQPFSNTAQEHGLHLRSRLEHLLVPRGPLTLQVRLADLLAHRRVLAWYWGHEHICALYDRHPLWGVYGRCIGHGGIPEFRHHFTGRPEKTVKGAKFYRVALPPNPACLVLDGPNEFIPGQHRSRGVA
jgi:hypothetical protein